MHDLRKLLVYGLNHLIEQGLLELKPTNNDAQHDSEHGYELFEIEGFKSMISWRNIGLDEIRLTVWWKYDPNEHPNLKNERYNLKTPLTYGGNYPKFVGACVSVWLERRKGPHIQGHGEEHLFNVYVRKGEKEKLKLLPDPTPIGFKSEGKF